MSSKELGRINDDLFSTGYAKTSYEAMGLEFDASLADDLSAIAAQGVFSPDAAKLTERIGKKEMTMVQDARSLELGRLMVTPVVETLFERFPEALEAWELYAMNCYQEGGELGVHQDSVGKTVLVVTASGVRNFDVYGRNENEETGFTTPEKSFNLEAGSIMILDGEADVGHSIRCVKGPSVSAILDVPAMLRN